MASGVRTAASSLVVSCVGWVIAPALAQDGRPAPAETAVEQIAPTPAGDGVEQISGRSHPQAAADQLTLDRRGAAAARRTPIEVQAPSQPSDGRTTATVAIGGHDRCDPASRSAAKRCENVIERRADQFASPPPAPLTPEQRLLIDQRLRDVPDTIETATRPPSRSPDAGAESVQGVASIVLRPPVPADAGKEPGPGQLLPPESVAIIQSLLQNPGTSR